MIRGGAKKRPFYQIVVAESSSPRDGRHVEKIGNYNPMLADNKVNLDKDRAKYWLEKGATPSDRLSKILAAHGFKVTVHKRKPADKSKKAAAEEAKAS